ncbi:MAG: carbohydrate kinase family protein [Solirubrobacteraceae bacterium]
MSADGRGHILCIGEALIDLICERPVRGLDEVDALVPHFGGATANVSVVAARAGARTTLAGGAGADGWGRWLRSRLLAGGVDVKLFELVEGMQTPTAVVTLDAAGEPTYTVYGDGAPAIVALEARIEAAVEQSSALFLSSNTLARAPERAVTMHAREVALTAGRPVVFDPNLRLHRWSSLADAAASANACVPGALLVRCNLAEAVLMTGEDDPERAALAMLKAGARLVVLTLGAQGAILRGELHADAAAVRARAISTVGAGDVFTGLLLAKLAATDFYPAAVAAGLREAVVASARACERWGAVD